MYNFIELPDGDWAVIDENRPIHAMATCRRRQDADEIVVALNFVEHTNREENIDAATLTNPVPRGWKEIEYVVMQTEPSAEVAAEYAAFQAMDEARSMCGMPSHRPGCDCDGAGGDR